MKRYLGIRKSPKYKRAQAAIARRNQIQVLTRRIKQLELLALKEEERKAAARSANELVSGGYSTQSITQPQLTNQPTVGQWQQLQQQLIRLNQHTQQLVEALNQERRFREAMTQEIELLKVAVGR